MSLDDYAVSFNVGLALRLSQVLASECPIESGRGFLEVDYAPVIMKDCYNELGICFTGVLLLEN